MEEYVDQEEAAAEPDTVGDPPACAARAADAASSSSQLPDAGDALLLRALLHGEYHSGCRCYVRTQVVDKGFAELANRQSFFIMKANMKKKGVPVNPGFTNPGEDEKSMEMGTGPGEGCAGH